MNYPNDLNAMATLNIPSGTLLEVTIEALDLMFEIPCANGDSLELSDGTQTLALCSDSLTIPFTWYSIEGATQVDFTFVTSSTLTSTGFTATYTVIEPNP